jgi:hypothetical protein
MGSLTEPGGFGDLAEPVEIGQNDWATQLPQHCIFHFLMFAHNEEFSFFHIFVGKMLPRQKEILIFFSFKPMAGYVLPPEDSGLGWD